MANSRDDPAEAHLARDREALLCDARELLDDAQIRLRLGQDARSLDLDRDQRPVVERGLVDLGRRRGREGHGIEGGVQDLGWRAELLGDDGDDVLVAERGRLALELRQLLDPLGRQDVAPAGHHLADLHVGRAELLEHRPDARRPPGIHEIVGLAQDDAGEPAPDRADRRLGQGDIETGGVDRVVDLLQAQVLDDRVATRRRQAFEEAPDPVASVGAQIGPVQPEKRIDDRGQGGVQRGTDDDPQPRRVGDDADLDRREDRGQPDRDRVDDHDEQAHGREQESSGQRHENGPREAVDQDEDRRPAGEADEPCAAERDDLGASGAERERLRDRDDPEEQQDDREQDGVDHHLDDETTHGVSSAVGPR